MNTIQVRLFYASSLLLTVLAASVLVDSHRRLSKILRIVGFAFIPAIFAGTRLIILHDFQLVLTTIAAMSAVSISLHAEGYYRSMFGISKYFQVVIDSCLALLILLFSSGFLAELLIYWFLVDLLVALVAITLEYGPENLPIAATYLVMCVAPSDIAVLTMFALVAYEFGLEQALTTPITSGPLMSLDPVASVLITFGFATKLGQFPLHSWLPKVHGEAPTHVSAMLSGLIIKLGIYCLIIAGRLFVLDNIAYYALIVQGIVTTLYGSMGAVIQSHVKRLLAYSSMAYGGVMILLYATYMLWRLETLYTVLLLIIAFHALAKTLSFLNASFIYQVANTYDVYKLGYLYYISKRMSFFAYTAFLNLLGAPPTMGFIAKTLLIASALEATKQGLLGLALVSVFAVFAVFSIAYSAKFLSVYISKIPRITPRVLPIPSEILRSEMTLAVATVLTPAFYILYIAHTNTSTFFTVTVATVYLALLAVFLLSLYREVLTKELFREDVKYWLSGVEA